MKLSINQAAFLYLMIFNIDEGMGRDPDDANDPGQRLADGAEHLLHDSEYPTDPMYDNDDQPMIDWESFEPGFNWNEWLFDGYEMNDTISGLLDIVLHPSFDSKTLETFVLNIK